MNSMKQQESWETANKLTKEEQESIILCQDAVDDLLFPKMDIPRMKAEKPHATLECFSDIHEALRSSKIDSAESLDCAFEPFEAILREGKRTKMQVEQILKTLGNFDEIHNEIAMQSMELISKSEALLLEQVILISSKAN